MAGRDANGTQTFTINADEAALLTRILNSYLGDFRLEIASTGNFEMREGMKEDERMIFQLLQRFGGEDRANAREEADVAETYRLTEEGR